MRKIAQRKLDEFNRIILQKKIEGKRIIRDRFININQKDNI